MNNPNNLWYSKVPKTSLREKCGLLVGVPVGIAAFFTFLHFTGKHLDTVQKIDDTAGRAVYTNLVKAADIDGNRVLSDMEKKLLCSRMNQYLSESTPPIARPYLEWSYCLTNPPLFFGGEIRKRAEKAIEIYHRDASP